MQEAATLSALLSLGYDKPNAADIRSISDGGTKLLRGDNGRFAALARHGNAFDLLAIGADLECPVGTLCEFLQSAVMPMSEDYARNIGLAKVEREKLKQRLREAAAALDVLAKGQKVRVRPANLASHPLASHYIASNGKPDSPTDQCVNNVSLVNELDSIVGTWKSELERIADLSRTGLSTDVSVEEEQVFWSSLDACLTAAQKELEASHVRFTVAVLGRNRRQTAFKLDMRNLLDKARLRAAGVLNLVQSLPIVPLRTADSESALCDAINKFWEHILSKLGMSSLSTSRVMALTHAMSAEVASSLKNIQESRGGLLNVSQNELTLFFTNSNQVFEAWTSGAEEFKRKVRRIAQSRKEHIPQHKEPAFMRLQKRIEEAVDFCSHKRALQHVLTQQNRVDISSTRLLDKLEDAFAKVVRNCDNGIALDISDSGVQKWTSMREEYSASTEDIEVAIANHFEISICAINDLEAMARFAKHYSKLTDKQFMEQATEVCSNHLVSIANNEIAAIRKQWDSYRTYNSKRPVYRNLPIPCSNVLQARVARIALDKILECARIVLGRLRVEHDQDMKEFVSDVKSLQSLVDEKRFFKNWEDKVVTTEFIPSCSLIAPLSSKGILTVGLSDEVVNSLRAAVFFEKDEHLGVKLNSDIRSRARESRFVLHVYSLISTAIENYNSASDLFVNLDGSVLSTCAIPLFSSLHLEARNSLMKCKKLMWNYPSGQLLDETRNCFGCCRVFADTLQAFVDEHGFVDRVFVEISQFSYKPYSINNAEDTTYMQELLRRSNLALKSIKERIQNGDRFNSYLQKVVKPALENAIDSVLDNSIRHWMSEVQDGRTSSLKASLRLSALGDHYQLEPEVNTLHSNALSTLEHLTCGVIKLFSTQELFFDDDPLKSIELRTVSQSLEPGGRAHDVSVLAVKVIEQELLKLENCINEWSKFTFLFCLEKAELMKTVSNNSSKASSILTDLNAIEVDVDELKRKYSTDSGVSIYLDATSAGSMLKTVIAGAKRDVLESCADFCATQSHEVFQLITKSKSDIKGAIGKSAMDVILLLKAVEENVFLESRETIQALRILELGIESVYDVSMPTTWISSNVLAGELGQLNQMHADKTKSSMSDISELKEKFKKEKDELNSKLSAFYSRIGTIWSSFVATHSEEGPDRIELAMDSVRSEISELKQESSRLRSVEKALGLENSSSDVLADAMETTVDDLCDSLRKLRDVSRRINIIGNTFFEAFSPRQVRKEAESIKSAVVALQDTYGTSEALDETKNKLEKHLEVHGLLARLRDCTLSAPRERDVLDKLFKEQGPTASLMQKKVEDFWKARVQTKEKYLVQVFELAAGESSLAEFMNGVKRAWLSRDPPFTMRDDTRILDGIPGLMDEVHEQIQALGTMASSKFVALFEVERKTWEDRLSKVLEVLEQLNEIQLQWLHLKSLFVAGGGSASALRRKLQKEFIAFSNVDAQIVSFFDDLASSPGLVEGLNTSPSLERLLGDLHEIVRSLSKFLESQRSSFPRFFFMSDADLLLTLSISPRRIEELNPILGKLFSGVGQLLYESDKDDGGIKGTGILSKEGEKLTFSREIEFPEDGSITEFLANLEKVLKDSLRALLPSTTEAIEKIVYETSQLSGTQLQEVLERFPSQLLLLAARVKFTEKVEQAFSESGESISHLHEALTKRLIALCSCQINVDEKKRGGSTTSTKREHLIKDLVYQRDTLSRLCQGKATNPSVYEWDHEVRMYLSVTGGKIKIEAHCASSKFSYGWEYLGVGDTLVQTPLTSRCYLTLTQALSRGFGGSPFGPAGTGKTETVKSLGRLLGRNVIVFNCDESFDSVSVGRILAGVSRVGFWVCFDEFNRLSASSLSATSQQLSVLQNAVKTGLRTVPNFYGGDVPIAIGEGIGIFVTTNPTYSGRREIPSNLKSLFRPCAMSKPDYLVIAEVLLMSYSFRSSHALGAKLVHLFESLKQVTRSRPHYDFGLRSMKSAIVIAGYLRKHIFSTKNSYTSNDSDDETEVQTNLSDADEELAVVLALHESLKPRLLPEDVQEYNAYVLNLFPNVTTQAGQMPEQLQIAISSACKDRDIRFSNEFLDRIGQLYNLLKHRPGVIIVGESGCGKSVAWKILFESLLRVSNSTSQIVDLELTGSISDKHSSLTVLDPKLLTSAQLYGSLDLTTREWTDGVFTKTLRECAQSDDANENEDFLHWIVFDGDIDPNWVENLNSVLDDTRLLTLPSGERIPLSSSIRILFEVDSLEYANPSTVSRCGLVYFDEGESSANVLRSQLARTMTLAGVNEAYKSDVLTLVGPYCAFAKDLNAIGKPVLRQPVSFFLSGTMTFFASILHQVLQHGGVEVHPGNSSSRSGKKADDIITPELLAHCFVFAAKTAIGSRYATEAEAKVYTRFLSQMSGCTHYLDEAIAGYDGANLLSSAFDVKSRKPFSLVDLASEEVVLENLPEQIGSPDIVIPTPSSTRLTQIVHDAIQNQNALHNRRSLAVLCGPPGCGKSMVLTSALNEMPGVELATISLSSRTSVNDVIAVLKAHMIQSKGRNGEFILSPTPPNKQTVLFCDECNLGEPDEFGTQHVANFLRCLVESNGFWNDSPPRWTHVENLRVVAACNPTEDAGRHELPKRLMRHAIVVCVEQPDRADLMTIFSVHLSAFLKYLDQRLEGQARKLTSAMVDFFLANKQQFAPNSTGPLEPHYVYSAREMIRWVRGMKRMLIQQPDGESASSVRMNSRGINELWDEVMNVFAHEAKRLFIDRLVASKEVQFAEKSLASVLRNYFGFTGQSVVDLVYSTWVGRDGNYLGESDSIFEKVMDAETFRRFLYHRLRVFAEEEGLGGEWVSGRGEDGGDGVIDQFAVSDDVIKHFARIERILSQPLGHAVLMGVPGTGKKTLARFVAWMMDAIVFQVRSHASYTADDFADDLRRFLRLAGVQHKRVVVIFDESNDLDSAFLEMMNSILACGDVPGLFEGDERASLLKEMQDARHRTGIADVSNERLYADFLDGVRENLHVVFSIPIVSSRHASNASGDNSVGRKDLTARSPALYNRCVVDWFGDWDDDTLDAVAVLKLEAPGFQEVPHLTCTAATMHEIAKQECMKSDHAVTPRHYIEFIEQLNRIAVEKGTDIEERCVRLGEGLEKLRNAGAAVDDFKDDVEYKKEQLKRKERKSAQSMESIMREQRHVVEAKADAKQLAANAKDAAEKTEMQEFEVTSKLAEVEPRVEKAKKAVNSVNRQHLEEIKSLPRPTDAVMAFLQVLVYMLTGAQKAPHTNPDWEALRRQMKNMDLVRQIMEFDITAMPVAAREKVRRKIELTPLFTAPIVMKASKAAGPLAIWVEATLEYADVLQSTAPLREQVKLLRVQQMDLRKQSEDAQNHVLHLEHRIYEFNEQYKLQVAEVERIKSEIVEAELKVHTAEDMLNSLAGEWDRWIAELHQCNKDADLLFGNAIFASAFVAYAGPLDQKQREKICIEWKSCLKSAAIDFNANMNLSHYLSSPEERAFWTKEGLPVDDTSLENYAILLRSARYPLILDPSGSASDLLRKIIGMSTLSIDSRENTQVANKRISVQPPSKLSTTSFAITGKKSYIRTVEAAVRFGTSVLVENAERFDNTCLPLLGQESSFGNNSNLETGASSAPQPRSQQRLVRLGERDIAISPGFRLYLSASDIGEVPQPAVARSSVVSFVLSPAALQAKCVSRTLLALHPAIEQQRTAQMIAAVTFEQKKQELENSLLVEIRNCDDVGQQLMSGSLANTLSKLKDETERIKAQEAENETLIIEAKNYEAKYQDLANAGLRLYHVLLNLQALNRLYRFSPSEFFNLFDCALKQATKTGANPQPSSAQIHYELVREVYLHIVPSLFPQHKLAFACALVVCASQFSDDSSFPCFSSDDVTELRSVFAKMAQTSCTLESNIVTQSKIFQRLDVVKSAQVPKNYVGFANSTASHLMQVLSSGSNHAGELPKLFDQLGSVIPGGPETLHGSSTRADVVLSSVMKLCAAAKEADGAVRAEDELFPSFLLCSRGSNSDPCELTHSMAKHIGLSVESIALSNEHTPEIIGDILATLRIRATKEAFVLLMKNIQLASRKCVEKLKQEIIKSQKGLPYLLVLAAEVGTSMNLPFFDLANNCRVLAFEVTPSLRTNLSRCHAVLNARFSGDDWLRRSYIAVTWLHGALLERRQYSPVGFSKPYDFTEADLVAAWDYVKNHRNPGEESNDQQNVSALIQMLAIPVYGGRVENKADSEVLEELISDLFQRVLIFDSGNPNVPVVDRTLVETDVIVPVEDPLMVRMMKNLPVLAPTDWFGMPPRTSESYKERVGRNILDVFLALTLPHTTAKVSGDDNAASRNASYEMRQTVQALLKQLPDENDEKLDHEVDTLNALDRFMERETVLCMEFIAMVRDDMQNLIDVLDGNARDSARCASLMVAAENWDIHGSAVLPKEWMSLSKYVGAQKTVRSLLNKLKKSYEWLKSASRIDKHIHIASALRASSLLSALGQIEAIELGVSQNTLYPVLSGENDKGWTVDGLALEGGLWNSHEGYVKMSDGPQETLPRCTLWWADQEMREKAAKEQRIKYVALPLYESTAREQLVAEIFVPTDPTVLTGKWKLAATALVITNRCL